MKHRKLTMAELARPSVKAFRQAEKLPLSLVLDDIRSANNVGSLFRTADGLGLAHVYLCGITARPPHRDILKTALGASESVSWSYHEDAAALVRSLVEDHSPCVRALEQTENSVPLQAIAVDGRPQILVVGNEVRGVSQAVIDACAGTIEIPQFGTKHSLNVAVAAGMAVWEISRKLRY